MSPRVERRFDGPIARLTPERAEKLNALDSAKIAALEFHREKNFPWSRRLMDGQAVCDASAGEDRDRISVLGNGAGPSPVGTTR